MRGQWRPQNSCKARYEAQRVKKARDILFDDATRVSKCRLQSIQARDRGFQQIKKHSQLAQMYGSVTWTLACLEDVGQ